MDSVEDDALGRHRGTTSRGSVTWRGRCQNITPVWAMNPHRACWEPWLTLQATAAATATADICQYVYDKSVWKTPNACRRVSVSGKISASHRSREEKYFLPFDSFLFFCTQLLSPKSRKSCRSYRSCSSNHLLSTKRECRLSFNSGLRDEMH